MAKSKINFAIHKLMMIPPKLSTKIAIFRKTAHPMYPQHVYICKSMDIPVLSGSENLIKINFLKTFSG